MPFTIAKPSLLYFAIGFIFSQLAYPGTARGEPDVISAMSPSELAKRVQQAGASKFEDAYGAYVFRSYNHTDNSQRERKVAQARKALEQARDLRIENELALGREVDRSALDAELEASLKTVEETIEKQGLKTHAVRYYQQGNAYRLEQFPLDNEAPVEELAASLSSGEILFRPTYIRTWSGKVYGEIVDPERRLLNIANDEKLEYDGAFASFAYKDHGAVPRFTKFGKFDGDPISFLQNATKKEGSTATVLEGQDKAGLPTLTLQIGDPKTVGLFAEWVFLPSEGYAVASSVMKTFGIVRRRSEYADFEVTSSGFRIPRHITNEVYAIDEKKHVPYMTIKEEFVAFDAPTTNVGYAGNFFDVTKSKNWSRLPTSNYLLPQQGDGRVEVPQLQADGTGRSRSGSN